MATSDDLVRRWREAKLGERRGDRVAVWVECEGDPRAEVLARIADTGPGLISPLAAAEAERARAEHGEIMLTGTHGTLTVTGDASVEAGTVTIADRPARRERKRGGRS